MTPKFSPQLGGVSETMLWTLYERACESRHPNSVLIDPDSVRICASLDYDFASHFGEPTGAFSARSVEIDRLVRDWLKRHPTGLVVSLGEGLETQARRVDNGAMRWLTVDLAPAIALRKQLIPPCTRFRQMAASVVDQDWLKHIRDGSAVLVIAQGLFMYLGYESVKRLIIHITESLPNAEIVFDTIPRWFSWLTLWGIMQTPCYQLPPMPWGVDGGEIEAQLRKWTSRIETVRILDYRSPRGWSRMMEDWCRLPPFARHYFPVIVHAKMFSE